MVDRDDPITLLESASPLQVRGVQVESLRCLPRQDTGNAETIPRLRGRDYPDPEGILLTQVHLNRTLGQVGTHLFRLPRLEEVLLNELRDDDGMERFLRDPPNPGCDCRSI